VKANRQRADRIEILIADQLGQKDRSVCREQ
jgi:hypothetical protein